MIAELRLPEVVSLMVHNSSITPSFSASSWEVNILTLHSLGVTGGASFKADVEVPQLAARIENSRTDAFFIFLPSVDKVI